MAVASSKLNERFNEFCGSFRAILLHIKAMLRSSDTLKLSFDT
jgi:hypothetical protein